MSDFAQEPPAPVDSPNPEIRFGLVAAGAFFILFLGFGAFVPVDSAGYAQGELATPGGRQLVQHESGGTLAAIEVREGEKVDAGDVLVELTGGETLAADRALAGQLLNLEAQRARLRAEQVGAATIDWPVSFAVEGAGADEIASAKALQDGEFSARRALLNSQVGVMAEQGRRAREAAAGYGSQMASTSEQARLIEEELDSLRVVADKGYVSKSRIRALERQRAELTGNRGQYSAGIAQAQSDAGATRLRQLEAVKQYRERAATELHDVELTLAQLRPKYEAAKDAAQKLKVRAPVSGTVMALATNTVGGVIAPGQVLMEIVPENPELVVNARVSLDDANDMRRGQRAQLRFATLHDRKLPIITGTVRHVSANSLADEKTGERFYTAEIVAPQSEFRKLSSAARDMPLDLRVGTPVEVLVPRRKRSLLAYLFEPLGDTLWSALREH